MLVHLDQEFTHKLDSKGNRKTKYPAGRTYDVDDRLGAKMLGEGKGHRVDSEVASSIGVTAADGAEIAERVDNLDARLSQLESANGRPLYSPELSQEQAAALASSPGVISAEPAAAIEQPDYSGMTRPELEQLAIERGLPDQKDAPNKASIIAALTTADNAGR